MSKRTKFIIGTALLVAAPFVFVVGGQLYSIGLMAVAGLFPGSGLGRDVLLWVAHVTAWGYALIAAISCALTGLFLTGVDLNDKGGVGP